MKHTVFDAPHTVTLVKERLALARRVLAHARSELAAQTLLDVGCGVGNASRELTRLGFGVTATDLREENVREARARSSAEEYFVSDVERPCDVTCPLHGRRFDVVFCIGLLYHLENPFAAVRHLAAHAGKLLVIESRVSPGASPHARFTQEHEDVDQSGAGIALVPSLAGLILMIRAAGLRAYELGHYASRHSDFRPISGARMRVVLFGSRSPLPVEKLGLSQKSARGAAPREVWR